MIAIVRPPACQISGVAIKSEKRLAGSGFVSLSLSLPKCPALPHVVSTVDGRRATGDWRSLPDSSQLRRSRCRRFEIHAILDDDDEAIVAGCAVSVNVIACGKQVLRIYLYNFFPVRIQKCCSSNNKISPCVCVCARVPRTESL